MISKEDLGVASGPGYSLILRKALATACTQAVDWPVSVSILNAGTEMRAGCHTA